MYFPLLADLRVICEFCKFDGLPIISSTIALPSLNADAANTSTISEFSDERFFFGFIKKLRRSFSDFKWTVNLLWNYSELKLT